MEKGSYLWYDFEPSRVQKNPANLKSDSFPKQLKKKLAASPSPLKPSTRTEPPILLKPEIFCVSSNPNLPLYFLLSTPLYSLPSLCSLSLLCSLPLLCSPYQSNAAIRTTPVSQKKKRMGQHSPHWP